MRVFFLSVELYSYNRGFAPPCGHQPVLHFATTRRISMTLSTRGFRRCLCATTEGQTWQLAPKGSTKCACRCGYYGRPGFKTSVSKSSKPQQLESVVMASHTWRQQQRADRTAAPPFHPPPPRPSVGSLSTSEGRQSAGDDIGQPPKFIPPPKPVIVDKTRAAASLRR